MEIHLFSYLKLFKFFCCKCPSVGSSVAMRVGSGWLQLGRAGMGQRPGAQRVLATAACPYGKHRAALEALLERSPFLQKAEFGCYRYAWPGSGEILACVH